MTQSETNVGIMTFVILAALLSLSLGFSRHCFGFDITFKQAASVSGPAITLGDLVDFDKNSSLGTSLKSQVICRSPQPGKQLTVDSRTVITKISALAVLPDDAFWKGSGTVTVHRKGVEVTSSKIISEIDSFIDSQKQWLPKADYRFIPRSLPLPFHLPFGQLKVSVIPGTKRIIGSKRFSMIYEVDGEVVNNFSILGHLEAVTRVAVSTMHLSRGAIIRPAQIEMKERDLSRLRNPATHPSLLIGKKLNRTIRADSVIDISNVVSLPMVQKGEFVKIILDRSGLQLTATGVARSNGRKNQVIRVKNISSQKDIFGRVTAPGIVEVRI
ncbi:MAG: flagellar basal body P-ring formation chaperone FlgA [Thermodesulfobacteriota bacterium]